MLILKNLKKKISKKYALKEFILFGSRSRGDYLLTSDVDILLVSPDFEKIQFKDRMADIIGFWNESVDLEPLCYTPEEFYRKKKQLGIVQQAVREGKNIAG